MQTIQFLAAPGGAGKSFAIRQDIENKYGNGQRSILAVPTIDLSAEHSQALTKRGVKVVEINKKNSEFPVAVINEHLFQPNPDPHVLVITQQALERLAKGNWQDGCHLYLDEIPQVHRAFEKVVPRSHPLLTTHISLENDFIAEYSRLQVFDRKAVLALAKNADGDQVLEPFQDLCRSLMCPDWQSYTKMASYEALIKNEGVTDGKLSIFSLLQPTLVSRFASVMIAGANFPNSLLYKYWTKLGVSFIERTDLPLRYRQHENGDVIKVYYFVEGNWSKTKAKLDKGKPFDIITSAVKDLFADKHFIYSQNKGQHLFKNDPAARMLPNSPHGLNEFQSYDNVAFLAARNPTPEHSKFLQNAVGLSSEEVTTFMHRETAYQSIMRSSARDPDNHKPKTFVFPDQGTASYIHSLFPQSELIKINSELDTLFKPKAPGRRRQYSSGAERTRECRKKKDLEAMHLLLQQPSDFVPSNDKLHNIYARNSCNENTLSIIDDFVTSFRCSVFSSVYNDRCYKLINATSIEGFESFLRQCHDENRYRRKEENVLASPSIFDPQKNPDHPRSLKSVVFATGLWFDLENGHLSPQQFSYIFPTLRMTIYSSFNSRKGAPRFRVFIPTTEVMTDAQYEAIIKDLVKTIERAGYGRKNAVGSRHGIDVGKLNAASLFYLPCQPANTNPDHNPFFYQYKDEGREPFDVSAWRERTRLVIGGMTANQADIIEPDWIRHEENVNIGSQALHSSDVELEDVHNIIDWWRTVASVPHQGNDNFFKLACRLFLTGMPRQELEMNLRNEAQYARSPNDRQRIIPQLLDWVEGNVDCSKNIFKKSSENPLFGRLSL